MLERRRMDLLSEEKELKGVEESAFWDGSYLLDGVLDRDGYSKETMTINARLTPPKGGAPVPHRNQRQPHQPHRPCQPTGGQSDPRIETQSGRGVEPGG